MTVKELIAYLESLGFKLSKLKPNRMHRADGFNIELSRHTATLYNQRYDKTHVATFIMPEDIGEANSLFKCLQVIKTKQND